MELKNLESLVVRPDRDSWLTAEVIEAALRSQANAFQGLKRPRMSILSASRWVHWVNGGFQPSDVPSISEDLRDIYVPINLGYQHWALTLIDAGNRTIFWFDSLEGVYLTRS
jgi:hypothetical protein